MDLKTKKLSIISYLLHLQDEAIINRIEELLITEKGSDYGQVPEAMTLEELETHLSESEADYEQGKVLSTVDVQNLLDKKNKR